MDQRFTTSKINVRPADRRQIDFEDTVGKRGRFLKHGGRESVSRECVGKQNDDPDARLNAQRRQIRNGFIEAKTGSNES